MTDSLLIVGLGNPGSKYENTWHNCGYDCVSALAKHLAVHINKKAFRASYGTAVYNRRKLILLKPETYMNLSGESVRAAADYYKIKPENILIIYDDSDLILPQLRMRAQGGTGSHNGMKSVKQHLRTENFARLRIGIGPIPEYKARIDYVLDKIASDRRKNLDIAIAKAVEGILIFSTKGVEEAMQFVNRQSDSNGSIK